MSEVQLPEGVEQWAVAMPSGVPKPVPNGGFVRISDLPAIQAEARERLLSDEAVLVLYKRIAVSYKAGDENAEWVVPEPVAEDLRATLGALADVVGLPVRVKQ
jgi:hypothetical protein